MRSNLLTGIKVPDAMVTKGFPGTNARPTLVSAIVHGPSVNPTAPNDQTVQQPFSSMTPGCSCRPFMSTREFLHNRTSRIEVGNNEPAAMIRD